METKYKLISNPSIARQLLHLGHKIVDIKPDRFGKVTSIFVFEQSEKLINDLLILAK